MEVRQICNLRAISVLLTPARYSFHPGGRGAPPFVVGGPGAFLSLARANSSRKSKYSGTCRNTSLVAKCFAQSRQLQLVL